MGAWSLNKIKNGGGGEVELVYKGDYTLSNPTNQYWYTMYHIPSGTSTEHDVDALVEGATVNGRYGDRKSY